MVLTQPDENVADSVTPTLATGTADASFPLTNLYNKDPSKPFKTTDSVGARITWNFGGAQRIDYVNLPNHNLPAGTAVKFQMNASDSWGSPSVDGAMTILAYNGDMPKSQGLNVTEETGYSASGYQYASLLVPSHGGITALGELAIFSEAYETNSLRFGVRVMRERVVSLHERQDGGRYVYDHLLTRRSIRGKFRHDPTDWAVLKAIWEASKGPVTPFTVDIAAAEEAMLVWWVSPLDPAFSDVDTRDIEVEWQEIGTGVPL